MILDNKFWPSNNKIKVLNAKGFKPKQQVSMIDLMSDMYRSIDILTVEAVNEQDNIITFLSPGKNLWLSSSFGLFADVTTATISTFGTNVQISYSDQDDPEILLDNVENLQFVFHLDDSDPGDGEVDICYNVIFDSSVSSRCSEKTIHTVASFDQNSAVSNPLKAPVINAVEIHLLVKYPQEEGKIKSVSHTFRIGDVVRNFNDGHQRRLVKQTVRLRNAALLE